MDPDTTLRVLRQLVTDGAAAGDGMLFDELAEHFAALDQWLTRGGFLPAAWAR